MVDTDTGAELGAVACLAVPQERGEVSRLMAEKLRNARIDMLEAQAHYEKVVLEALKAGGSYREIAKCLEISHAAVSKFANRIGWPPPEMKAERERKAAENREWQRQIDALTEAKRNNRIR